MAVTDTQILERRLAYACCLGEYVWQWNRAKALGRTAEAKKWRHKAWTMHMALTVMLNANVAGELEGEMCVDDDMLCCIIRIADPICVKCGCSDSASDDDNAPPVALRSFDIRAESFGIVATVVPAPNLTPVNFNFVTEPQWTISFWFRWYDGNGIYLNNKMLTLMNYTDPPDPEGDGASLYVTMIDDGGGGAFISLELSLGTDPVGEAASVLAIVPNDDQWHLYTLTRNGPYDQEATWQWYVDGQPAPMGVVYNGDPAFLAGGFPYAAQAPMIGSNTYYSDIPALQSEVRQSFRMCELYVCGTGRSAGEVLSTFYTNTMHLNDASWNRLVWLHPHNNDVDQAIGGIANDGQLPNYTAYQNAVLDSDVPAQLSP